MNVLGPLVARRSGRNRWKHHAAGRMGAVGLGIGRRGSILDCAFAASVVAAAVDDTVPAVVPVLVELVLVVPVLVVLVLVELVLGERTAAAGLSAVVAVVAAVVEAAAASVVAVVVVVVVAAA